MATLLLKYGDYQGDLPEGWRVLEVPPFHKLVNENEANQLIDEHKEASAIITQTALVFAKVNKLDPGIFGKTDVNWGAFIMKLHKASDINLGTDFAKLNELVQSYSKKHNISLV